MENLAAPAGLIAVIGCGNLNRRDDGIGVVVAQALQQWVQDEHLQGVSVYDAGTGGMDVMFKARGATALIMIDASLSSSTPGSIFKLPGEEVIDRPEPGYSLHDFRWQHALYAGRHIFGKAFPHDITVYLIEAETVTLGLGLSPRVSQAASQVADMIKQLIREKTNSPASALSHSAPSDTPHAASSPDGARMTVRQGSIFIDASTYARYFLGLECIVLLRQEHTLMLLPVRHAAAGGLLMKVRNAQGDRVIHAQEFFRGQGIDDDREWTGSLQWNEQRAALVTSWPAPS
ncbi:MAG: hydrogenase maturation protease [Nitrospira sp.]|nr:hydrogenase maturation protease [Nitrospira sp.]